METQIFWKPVQEIGLEHLRLMEYPDGIVADSIVLGQEPDKHPFRFWYQVRMDSNWQVQECLLHAGKDLEQTLHLYSDGQGNWTDATDQEYPTLTGCLDIDIRVSPFTNTLPIRRLKLEPEQSAEILVAYISAPDLEIRPMQQRYTCLSSTDTGGLYRYESLESGFTRDLQVDALGLVLDYPGIWKRVS